METTTNESAIDQLATATQTVGSMTRRVSTEENMKEIRTLQEEMRQAIESKDKKALDLINIRLEGLIAAENEEKAAFVDKLKFLKETSKSLGVEIEVAEGPTPEEESNLASAQAGLKDAEAARQALHDDPPFWFPGTRKEAAEEEVATAKQVLDKVESDNARSASKRLDEIDIERASQRLIAVSEAAQSSVESRRGIIDGEVTAAVKEIERLQSADHTLATQLDELKIEVARTDQLRSDAEVDLGRQNPGTEAYSTQQKVVQDAVDAYKVASNERDLAMGIKNEVQRNLELTKAHLNGQRDLAKGLIAFQKTLEEQLNGLVVQYKSRVEAARALADLKFASDVHATGSAVQEDFANFVVKAGSSANQEVVDMAEKQPEAIRAARETLRQQKEAYDASQAKIDAVFEDMERDYQPESKVA